MKMNCFEYLWNSLTDRTLVLAEEMKPLEYRTVRDIEGNHTLRMGSKAYTLAPIALVMPDTRLFKLFYKIDLAYGHRVGWRQNND